MLDRDTLQTQLLDLSLGMSPRLRDLIFIIVIDTDSPDIEPIDNIARRRDTEDKRTNGHDHKVERTQDHKRQRQANSSGKRVRDLGHHNGASSKPTDSQTSSDTTTVREPFLEGRDGGNVGDAQTQTTKDAIADIDQSDHFDVDAEGGDQVAYEEQYSTQKAGFPGTVSFKPRAHDRR